MFLAPVGNPEMDIWSQSFADNFSIIFKVCVCTDKEWVGSAKCGQMWTGEGAGHKSLKMCEHPLWMAPIWYSTSEQWIKKWCISFLLKTGQKKPRRFKRWSFSSGRNGGRISDIFRLKMLLLLGKFHQKCFIKGIWKNYFLLYLSKIFLEKKNRISVKVGCCKNEIVRVFTSFIFLVSTRISFWTHKKKGGS